MKISKKTSFTWQDPIYKVRLYIRRYILFYVAILITLIILVIIINQLSNLYGETFTQDFISNGLSTLIGVVVGIPIALWITNFQDNIVEAERRKQIVFSLKQELYYDFSQLSAFLNDMEPFNLYK